MCRDVKVLEGAQETLLKWKTEGHSVHIVTARPSVIVEGTREMVKTHFPMVDSVNFCNMGEDKNVILERLGCTVFIDDAPLNLEAALGRFRVLMISNKYTKYNHHLQQKIEFYKAIKEIPDSVFGG